jgi:hypothetical protein
VRVAWTLDLAGSTSFQVQKAARGRLSDGRCVKLESSNASGHHCTRLVSIGSAILRSGAIGANAFQLSTRGLAPGSYRLVVSGVASNGTRGPSVRAAFTVVR